MLAETEVGFVTGRGLMAVEFEHLMGWDQEWALGYDHYTRPANWPQHLPWPPVPQQANLTLSKVITNKVTRAVHHSRHTVPAMPV